MFYFSGAIRRLRSGAGIVLAAGLLALAGCGEKSTTSLAPAPPPQPGKVFVDTEPDSLAGPWRLTGPSGFVRGGQGDLDLTDLATGEYVITWEAVPDWNPPFPQKQTLTSGGEVHFQGAYTKGVSFAGLEFGTVATLEIATWNIEHFPKRDQLTVDLVARAVLAMDIDILALQEIESAASFEDLDNRLIDWTGVRSPGSAYNINLAFLYRNTGDWTIDSVGEILTGFSREFPRSPLVMEGRFKGTSVVVINNHFKCCGDNYISGDPWDEEVRRRDAGQLLDQYVRTQYPGRKVFIVGDLNDSLTDDPQDNVFRVFLDDPGTWRFVDMGIAAGPSSGWSFPGWPSHLDHILINAPLFTAAAGPAAEIRVLPVFSGLTGGWSEYDRNMSDHLPVAIKLVP